MPEKGTLGWRLPIIAVVSIGTIRSARNVAKPRASSVGVVRTRLQPTTIASAKSASATAIASSAARCSATREANNSGSEVTISDERRCWLQMASAAAMRPKARKIVAASAPIVPKSLIRTPGIGSEILTRS